jgi:peptide/nickel transport system substrate-binding protein
MVNCRFLLEVRRHLMKHLGRLFVVGAAAVLALSLVVPAVAQDTPAPGEGGIVIEGNFGGDPATLNPVLASDATSQKLVSLLFPGLISVDPKTALFRKNGPDALVTDWDVSADGKVYTFKMRSDWKWTDGTPITSKDVVYVWDAIKSGDVDTQDVFLLDIIDKVEAVDDTTFKVTYKNADCTALGSAGVLIPMPSHVLPTDFKTLGTSDYNLNPTVTGGVFSFGEFRAGEQVSLLANQTYGGATDGKVIPTGFIFKVVPDQQVLTEQFLAGETNVIDGPPVGRRADVLQAQTDGKVTAYQFPGNSWDYIGLNFADPKNPKSALDDKGNPIDQGHHPLFGDPLVREAMSKAIDVDAIVKGAVFGFGTRMPSMMIPASWAFDKTLAPISLDVEAAKKLLDQAGFVVDPANPNGPRIAKGAKYAPDGTPLKFTLYTNEGNSRRGTVGTLVQDQLKQVGFQVDFQAIDFNTLLDIINGQTYDAFVLGWLNGYPDDPDQTQLFSTKSDVVPGGSNSGSYSNADVDKLMEQARALPGCDPAARAKIYAQIQGILQKDLPYIPLYSIEGMYAASSTVSGFSPYPSQLYWNVDTWAVKTP